MTDGPIYSVLNGKPFPNSITVSGFGGDGPWGSDPNFNGTYVRDGMGYTYTLETQGYIYTIGPINDLCWTLPGSFETTSFEAFYWAFWNSMPVLFTPMTGGWTYSSSENPPLPPSTRYADATCEGYGGYSNTATYSYNVNMQYNYT